MERRLGAYVENLYRLGMEFNPDWVLNVRQNEQVSLEDLGANVAKLVKQGVTGWVCAADHQAYHLVNELKKHKISVPEDCSITGFDGVRPPSGLPQLTTVKVAFKDMGVSSVVSLLRTVSNPTAGSQAYPDFGYHHQG